MKSITRKTLLYKSKVEYADYCLNHILGCAHGCKYPCYAMTQKIRHKNIIDYKDWVNPKIVSNALELLEKEIPKLKNKIKLVYLCFCTDPFMYNQKEVIDLTLKIIKSLNQENINCLILTKGIYPKQLLNTKIYSKDNIYGISLVSLSEKFRERWEPGAAPIKKRINSLERLSKLGLNTIVSMEPYPTPNIIEQDLNALLNRIKFTDKIIFGRLNYNKIVGAYKKHKDFYTRCVDTVTGFCGKHKIISYIKNGTK